ncbi:DNA cytosine methyltransferase, partial [Corynebacterium striatum]
MHTPLTSIEICAGASGQALGLERAGFNHLVAVEIDDWEVKTLQANRPEWNVIQADVLDFDVSPYAGA